MTSLVSPWEVEKPRCPLQIFSLLVPCKLPVVMENIGPPKCKMTRLEEQIPRVRYPKMVTLPPTFVVLTLPVNPCPIDGTMEQKETC